MQIRPLIPLASVLAVMLASPAVEPVSCETDCDYQIGTRCAAPGTDRSSTADNE